MNRLKTVAADARRHSFFEDGYAFLTGCSFVVLGLVWLQSAGLVTGGIGGLSLLLSYLIPLPAGVLFAFLNIPFFIVAGQAMGRSFVVRAVLANLLILGFAIMAPLGFRVEEVNALFAALFGGTVIGAGILILARHNVGVGGLGILALALQKSRGWNVGKIQLAGDALILCAALPVLEPGSGQLAISILSVVAVSGVLIVFNKPGRYTGY